MNLYLVKQATMKVAVDAEDVAILASVALPVFAGFLIGRYHGKKDGSSAKGVAFTGSWGFLGVARAIRFATGMKISIGKRAIFGVPFALLSSVSYGLVLLTAKNKPGGTTVGQLSYQKNTY